MKTKQNTSCNNSTNIINSSIQVLSNTAKVGYGDKSISNYKNEEIIPSIQCFKNRAFKNGNLCPKCKNLTLTFDYADVLYD